MNETSINPIDRVTSAINKALEGREAPARTDLGLQPPLNGRTGSDPAPEPIEAARARAAQFVHNISMNTLLDLRRQRDAIDNAIERIEVSERALTDYITKFANFNLEALETGKQVKAAIDHLVKPFSKDPPTTITQEGSK